MKRALLLMLLCVTFLVTGCAQQPAADAKPAMYIEPALLSGEEELIKSIASQGRNCNIYDFQLGKEQQGITVSVYRLENGQWALYTGGSQLHLPAQEGKGRFALNFGPLTEGIFTSMLDEKSNVMTWHHAPAEILYDVAGLNVTTTQLSAWLRSATTRKPRWCCSSFPRSCRRRSPTPLSPSSRKSWPRLATNTFFL